MSYIFSLTKKVRCFVTLLAAALFLGVVPARAQMETGSYFLLGYTLGSVNNGAAYGYKNVGGKEYNVDYFADSFTHDTFGLRYMVVNDDFYYDVDLQALTMAVFMMNAFLSDETIDGDTDADMGLFPGTGLYGDFGKNMGGAGGGLALYGTDVTIISADVLGGGGMFQYGLNFSINGIGGNSGGQKVKELSNAQNLRFLANKSFMAFGPALGYTVLDNLFAVMRVNYILGFKDNGEIELDTRGYGFELYPTIRFLPRSSFSFWNSDIGLYAEAYMKYRRFFEQKATNPGVRMENETITIPAFSTTSFGITIGIYLHD